jgi:hypothetical protein
MKMKSTVRCIYCNKDYDMLVDPADLTAWSEGELIQVALDYLSEGERELLLSGTCDTCWDEMYGEDGDIMTVEHNSHLSHGEKE